MRNRTALKHMRVALSQSLAYAKECKSIIVPVAFFAIYPNGKNGFRIGYVGKPVANKEADYEILKSANALCNQISKAIEKYGWKKGKPQNVKPKTDNEA